MSINLFEKELFEWLDKNVKSNKEKLHAKLRWYRNQFEKELSSEKMKNWIKSHYVSEDYPTYEQIKDLYHNYYNHMKDCFFDEFVVWFFYNFIEILLEDYQD